MVSGPPVHDDTRVNYLLHDSKCLPSRCDMLIRLSYFSPDRLWFGPVNVTVDDGLSVHVVRGD